MEGKAGKARGGLYGVRHRIHEPKGNESREN